MDKPFIIVSSVTYAMKGRQLLSTYGIKSEVHRTPKHTASQSCTYSLYVPKQTDEAEKILNTNGIKVIGRMERS